MSTFPAANSRNADLCSTRLENELDEVLIQLERTLAAGEPIGAVHPGGVRTFPFVVTPNSDARRYRLVIDQTSSVETLSGETDQSIVERLIALGDRLPAGVSGTFVASSDGSLSYAGGDIPPIYLKLMKIGSTVGQCHSVQELSELVTAAIKTRTTMLVLNGDYPSSPYIVELAVERLLNAVPKE